MRALNYRESFQARVFPPSKVTVQSGPASVEGTKIREIPFFVMAHHRSRDYDVVFKALPPSDLELSLDP